MPKQPPIVSTDWLTRHLHDPDIVLLDASVFLDRVENGAKVFQSGVDAFLTEGHLPGARFADLFTEFSDPAARFPFMRPSAAQFEAAAGRLGISPASHVVIYDNLVGQWAARLWWVFRTFGHRNVSVLDGGMRKYVRDGGRLDKGLNVYGRTSYAGSRAARYVATQQDVIEIVGGGKPGTLVCFLQPADFTGAVTVRARPGHIPGSVNLPFNRLIDEGANTLLDADRLRAEFGKVVPLNGDLIVTYCGGGIASTFGALALAVLGYENTLEYDGSLAEWLDNPNLPLAMGES